MRASTSFSSSVRSTRRKRGLAPFRSGGWLVCICVGLALMSGANWLRFRGPNGSGLADDLQLPTSWSDTENIAWKAALPGRGISGPIVIGDRVVLTCASGFRNDRLHVLCFDAHDGTRQWERQLWATGRSMTHPSICPAAPTPASDGSRIFAYFSSNDLACFDLEGNLLWLRGLMMDYPNASNSLGLASSPVIVGETLVVAIENDSQSLAVGLDASTGETNWKIDRPAKSSWTSPVVISDGSKSVVLLQSGPMLSAHDAHTGEELWQYEQGCSTMSSSVAQDGVVYVPSNGLTALVPNDSQAGPEVLWQNNRLSPSTTTPLVYDNKILSVGGSILRCGDAKTGKSLWQTRLTGNFSCSPVLAGSRMYLFNDKGVGQIVDLFDARPRATTAGDLGETILCSPAISNAALYVRSDHSLWKIAKADRP
jgi:outer membrane protein assembly factor BamB